MSRYNKRSFLIVGLFLTVLCGQARAWHLEAFGSAGYGTAEITDEAKSPNMGVYQLGGTFGFDFVPMFYAGASASYQKIVQFSDTNQAYGNRKGARPDIAPTLGFSFLAFHLKYEYKLWGDYKLDKKTSTGQEVIYKSPSGHRLTFQFSLLPLVRIGVYAETIEFDKIEQGGAESNLAKPLDLTHYGVVVSAAF